MTNFEERERAFEAVFAQDQEMRFRAEARCAKLLATWACEHMGLSGRQADHYVQSSMTRMVEGNGIDRLIEKMREDFEAVGATSDVAEIELTVSRLTARAAAEVRRERLTGGERPKDPEK
jgi:hypothetical protein